MQTLRQNQTLTSPQSQDKTLFTSRPTRVYRHVCTTVTTKKNARESICPGNHSSMLQADTLHSYNPDDICTYSKFIFRSLDRSIWHTGLLTVGSWTAVCKRILQFHQWISETETPHNHCLPSTKKRPSRAV